MRKILRASALLWVTHLAFSQSPTSIAGITEPPELSGEPKKVTQLTEVQRQFGEIVLSFKDEASTRASQAKLSKFIEDHPDYSDAYFVRVVNDLCTLNSHDYASMTKDIDTAIQTHSLAGHESMYPNLVDHYSYRAKVELATAQYKEALADLSTAMNLDLDSADKIFNISGIEPERTSSPCIWNLADLDTLVAKFPQDFRPVLLRGLYFQFFTTFKEDYYPKALQELQRAVTLNPKSPLPPYFIGRNYTKASFWTKAVWSSDEARNLQYQKAIAAYTRAIQLDPKFRLAYGERASAYHGLKEWAQAIKDYDKVLELDPDNAGAANDRGLAKMEIGQYFSAALDFGEAIRHKDAEATTLAMSYENRGDAYVKTSDYRSAISDYTKAIERGLASQSILFSVDQFRALYPEYDGVSNEAICRKLHALFWAQMEYGAFVKTMEGNGKWAISGLNDLYEKRGDAYMRASNFRQGVLDFNRIFKGIPSFADTVDRWRFLGVSGDGEKYYLDVKSAEFTYNKPVSLWIKGLRKNESFTLQSLEIDCKNRRTRQTSISEYDSKGSVLSSSEVTTDWTRVIPDTMGEQWYKGACAFP